MSNTEEETKRAKEHLDFCYENLNHVCLYDLTSMAKTVISKKIQHEIGIYVKDRDTFLYKRMDFSKGYNGVADDVLTAVWESPFKTLETYKYYKKHREILYYHRMNFVEKQKNKACIFKCYNRLDESALFRYLDEIISGTYSNTYDGSIVYCDSINEDKRKQGKEFYSNILKLTIRTFINGKISIKGLTNDHIDRIKNESEFAKNSSLGLK